MKKEFVKNMKQLIILLCLFPTLIFAQEDSVYTSLEEALKNPKQVYQLNLSQQDLKEFPKTIFTLTFTFTST